MKKIFIILLSALCLCVSCKYYGNYGTDNVFYSGNSVNNRTNGLKELEEDWAKKLPSEYSFFVLTDVHIGSIRNNSPKLPDKQLFAWIESFSLEERPRFCIVLGDVADTGSSNQYVEYGKFVKKIEAYGIKVLNSVGNHDLYVSGWEGWKKTCYPYNSFYRFQTPNFSFYSLDTGTGNVGSNQLKDFYEAIKKDSRPKIVYTHYPLYTETFFFNMEDTTERNLLIAYCAQNNVKLFLSGHLHWYEKMDFNTYQAFILPSYRYKGQWAHVTVNEKTEKYELKIVSKD